MVTTVLNSIMSGTNETCKAPGRTGYGEQLPLAYTSKSGVPAPNPLTIQTPVPDKFSPEELEAMMPSEAATYSWAFQGIRNLVDWWPCSKEFNGSLSGFLSPADAATSPAPMAAVTSTPSPPEDEPLVNPMPSNPGVYTLRELNKNRDRDAQRDELRSAAKERGAGGSGKERERPARPPRKVENDYPFFGMYYDQATPGNRLFVILIRGTNTRFEWGIDFDYSRVPNSPFPSTGPENDFPGAHFEGETHMGFTKVFNAMWPTIQQALIEHVIPPTGDPSVGVTRVMVAGQSLGGGVGSLVAYGVQKFLNHAWVDKMRYPHAPPVDCIVFGSPNVGNTAFKESMRAIGVNSRRVTFVNDVVTDVPCASAPNSRLASMPACPLAPVSTGRDAAGQRTYFWDDYQPIAGTVLIGPQDLPVQHEEWRVTELHMPIRGNLPHAAHTCAYSCYASRWNQDDTQNRCLLAEPAIPGHSFCRGFPAPPSPAAQRRRSAVPRLSLAN
ncbi:MAG: class 3-domain-containing protein [Monoraphidium minutum]|nr:MAG: class 3-domain-containing protein [Monoraphidium minutum]